MNGEIVFEADRLTTTFRSRNKTARFVDDVSFQVRRGETLAIVGESGCGKSMTALSIMRLLPAYSFRIEGRAELAGQDLLSLPDRAMESLRGNRLAMIFQEPMSALNPVYSVGRQVCEVLLRHNDDGQSAATDRTVELFRYVGIPDAERRLKSFPHELSGGLRQRVMIAMALACKPSLLIADEPTTALDVTIQAQILDLFEKMQSDLGTSIIMITHDLGVVARVADRVAVMYAGRVIEEADVDTLFAEPSHPYTQNLLAATPRLLPSAQFRREPFRELAGTVPSLFDLPAGCAFAPRCSQATAICTQERPEIREVNGLRVACHHARLPHEGLRG